MLSHINMINMMVQWYVMVYSSKTFLFALAHKFTNISAERIAGQKQNSLTKQEPEGTYNIDLNNFFKKIGQVAKSQFPRK